MLHCFASNCSGSLEPHLRMSNIGTIQREIEQLGREIFDLIDDDRRTPRLFGEKDFYGRLMEWAMRDPVFKTQMFRFVDVLPTLTSSGDVVKHLAEYLSSVKTPASGVLRGALAFGRLLPAMPAHLIRQNVLAMANIFICGRDGKSAFPEPSPDLGRRRPLHRGYPRRSGRKRPGSRRMRRQIYRNFLISWPQARALGKWKGRWLGVNRLLSMFPSKSPLFARGFKRPIRRPVSRPS